MTNARTNPTSISSSSISTPTRKSSRSLFSSDESNSSSSSHSSSIGKSSNSLFSSGDEVETKSLVIDPISDSEDNDDFVELKGNGLHAYEEQASALLNVKVLEICVFFNKQYKDKLSKLTSYLLRQYQKIPQKNLEENVEVINTLQSLFVSAFSIKTKETVINPEIFITFELTQLSQKEKKQVLAFIHFFSSLVKLRLYLNHLLDSDTLLNRPIIDFVKRIEAIKSEIAKNDFKHTAGKKNAGDFSKFNPGITYVQIETGKNADNIPLKPEEILTKIEQKLAQIAELYDEKESATGTIELGKIPEAIEDYAFSIKIIEDRLKNFIFHFAARKQVDCNLLQIELETLRKLLSKENSNVSKSVMHHIKNYIIELDEAFETIFSFYNAIYKSEITELGSKKLLNKQLTKFIEQKKKELRDKALSLGIAIEDSKKSIEEIKLLKTKLLTRKNEINTAKKEKEKANAAGKAAEKPSTSTSTSTRSSTLTFKKRLPHTWTTKGKEVEHKRKPEGASEARSESTAKQTPQEDESRKTYNAQIKHKELLRLRNPRATLAEDLLALEERAKAEEERVKIEDERYMATLALIDSQSSQLDIDELTKNLDDILAGSDISEEPTLMEETIFPTSECFNLTHERLMTELYAEYARFIASKAWSIVSKDLVKPLRTDIEPPRLDLDEEGLSPEMQAFTRTGKQLAYLRYQAKEAQLKPIPFYSSHKAHPCVMDFIHMLGNLETAKYCEKHFRSGQRSIEKLEINAEAAEQDLRKLFKFIEKVLGDKSREIYFKNSPLYQAYYNYEYNAEKSVSDLSKPSRMWPF